MSDLQFLLLGYAAIICAGCALGAYLHYEVGL